MPAQPRRQPPASDLLAPFPLAPAHKRPLGAQHAVVSIWRPGELRYRFGRLTSVSMAEFLRSPFAEPVRPRDIRLDALRRCLERNLRLDGDADRVVGWCAGCARTGRPARFVEVDSAWSLWLVLDYALDAARGTGAGLPVVLLMVVRRDQPEPDPGLVVPPCVYNANPDVAPLPRPTGPGRDAGKAVVDDMGEK